MTFWDKIKKDLSKGIKEGMAAMKEGAEYVKVKAGELTEEGKRRVDLFELKSKVQRDFEALGGQVYHLHTQKKQPMNDAKVKAVLNRIRKLESKIARLEKPGGSRPSAKRKKATGRQAGRTRKND